MIPKLAGHPSESPGSLLQNKFRASSQIYWIWTSEVGSRKCVFLISSSGTWEWPAQPRCWPTWAEQSSLRGLSQGSLIPSYKVYLSYKNSDVLLFLSYDSYLVAGHSGLDWNDSGTLGPTQTLLLLVHSQYHFGLTSALSRRGYHSLGRQSCAQIGALGSTLSLSSHGLVCPVEVLSFLSYLFWLWGLKPLACSVFRERFLSSFCSFYFSFLSEAVSI